VVTERRIITKNLAEPGWIPTLACYERSGGYASLRKAIGMKPEEVCAEVEKSGLRGRGGAGFPAGMKWKFLDRKSGKPIYLICNADESEPGTFKDRQILHRDPHQLIEGMMITCYAVQAKLAFIYIREEFPEAANLLEQAIAEARGKNLVGEKILGSNYSCEIIVHRGAGAYICGEETGLIESLEGKRAYPRIKPPYFPATLGLYHCPTVVNNVETLCNVVHIINMGGEAYSKIGKPNNTGTRIISVSGHVQKPGFYEFECGAITLGQLINEVCGGALPGRTLKAIIPGGSSSKILKCGERYKFKTRDGKDMDWSWEDIPMDFDSFASIGTMSGSGAVIVLDDSVKMLDVLANINAFYAHESCGQCTPCREGSLWMKKITARMASGDKREGDAELLLSIAKQIEGKTICAFGEACSWPVMGMVGKFKEEL